MNKTELILIKKDNEIIGYEVDNAAAYMQSIGKQKEWSEWYIGQTGAIINGKFVVYKTDVDRFLQGLPDFDLTYTMKNTFDKDLAQMFLSAQKEIKWKQKTETA